jgi:hypothetical protein
MFILGTTQPHYLSVALCIRKFSALVINIRQGCKCLLGTSTPAYYPEVSRTSERFHGCLSLVSCLGQRLGPSFNGINIFSLSKTMRQNKLKCLYHKSCFLASLIFVRKSIIIILTLRSSTWVCCSLYIRLGVKKLASDKLSSLFFSSLCNSERGI